MSSTKEMSLTEYFTAVKEAADPEACQQLVLGTVYNDDEKGLEETYEALIEEAEEAGDFEDFDTAAKAFRALTVLAWAQNDSRMIENFATQALYYGTLVDLDTLLENYTTVWGIWAHLLPNLRPRERMRLQDFARFRRSFQLGLRERDESDERMTAAVSLLAPTFDSMGAINLKGIEDRSADLSEDAATLWDETDELIEEIVSSSG